jgi:hypothetical protein
VKKILVVGDSFAADWTKKYPEGYGWVNLLSAEYAVTNLAQAGVGEYKILQQIKSVPDIQMFDLVLISHTSPYRIHTRKHPVHHADLLHKHADLIMEDIEYHSKKLRFAINRGVQSARDWFYYHFDTEYQENIYRLIKQEIHRLLGKTKSISINNYTDPYDLDHCSIDVSSIQLQHPGLHNHMDTEGNHKLCQLIIDKINALE